MEGSKACTKCGVVKLFSEFGKQADGAHGLRADCRACHAAYCRTWHKKNPEKSLKWKKENPEKAKASVIAWIKANPEKNRQSQKASRRKSVEKLPFWYVAKKLHVPASELPYDLYLLKREQILNARALRQFNEVLKGINDGKRSDSEPADNGDLSSISSIDERRCATSDSGDYGRA